MKRCISLVLRYLTASFMPVVMCLALLTTGLPWSWYVGGWFFSFVVCLVLVALDHNAPGDSASDTPGCG